MERTATRSWSCKKESCTLTSQVTPAQSASGKQVESGVFAMRLSMFGHAVNIVGGQLVRQIF